MRRVVPRKPKIIKSKVLASTPAPFIMSFQVSVISGNPPSNHTFPVSAGQTVLDAALAAGIVLPYSCRNGACSSCKAKVVSGDYDAGLAPAQILDSDDIAQGYTLLCQVRPGSDLVIEATVVRLAGDVEVRKLPARVIGMRRVAPDVMVLTLQLPAADPLRFYAGQYVDMLLRDGQRRSYSIARAPHADGPLELHVRHLPGGVFTDHVFGAGVSAMKERDIVRLEGPLGSFFLREDSAAPIVLLASGTGFAPIKAIVEHIQHQGITRPVRLYWGGRRPHDLYLDALAREWEALLPDLRYVPVVSDALPEDGWTGRDGFVHHAVMADLPDLSGWQVYACGAPVMVEAARHDFVRVCGLPEAEFYADAFTSQADVAALAG